MKVSIEWLKQFINITQRPEDLAETLTRGGIEVGGVENLSEGFEQVVIGEIQEMTKHPNADKLWICKVNTGSESLTIVTGAQNLELGDKIPVALVGAVLPNGLAIKPAKLRGVDSTGMLCSTEELLLEESAGLERSLGGIMILPQDAPLGQNLAQYLGREDSVLDLELYPNRPDCLAMVNVAREVASLTGQKVSLPKWAELEAKPDLPQADVKIVIDEPELSWRYAGLLVEDVNIAPSPAWMKQRLQAAGVRPINNIVDITNYVMLEMGQPLHAFDRDTISGAVHVRRANPGEVLTTLDKVERKLDPDMLLIADDEKALGLAGVMGGLDSEVTGNTKRLLVESAHFAGVSIRRTSRKLGLRSEASNRFEKGVNPHGIVATLGRVSELLVELGAGRPVALVDEVRHLPQLSQISLSAEHTSDLLGIKVEEAEIEKVLDRLDFNNNKQEGTFLVDIPSYRSDLQIEVDLIEEVSRLIGYDRIPTTLPQGNQTQGVRTSEQEFRRKLRKLLLRLGMNEVLTYSFTSLSVDKKWGFENQSIPIMNPLREELGVMRTSLIPGLLEVAARNTSRRNTALSIFEIGNIYLGKELPLQNLPKEILRVAGLAVGKSERHWVTPVLAYDFYYLKGMLEELEREFGLEFVYKVPENQELLHPGRSAEVYLKGNRVGFIGEMHPALEKEWDLEKVVLFELDLEPLISNARGTVIAQSIPRFPAVQRDLAIVVSKETPTVQVMEKIKGLGGELLQRVDIFDVYTGKPIPEDRKSLAFNLRYQALDRTLKDEEVNELNSRILEGIQQEFAAEWRK